MHTSDDEHLSMLKPRSAHVALAGCGIGGRAGAGAGACTVAAQLAADSLAANPVDRNLEASTSARKIESAWE